MSSDVSTPADSGEAPLTLNFADAQLRTLGFKDQFTLWSSLGVSLLIPATAVFVLQPSPQLPPLSFVAVVTAIVVGTAVGSYLLALSAVVGSVTGAATMVMLRGLLGQRGSVVPTVLNLAQCCGWAALEVYVIAQVGAALTSSASTIWWTVGAGAVATIMAIRPIRSVRVIRRYLMWLVLATSVYLIAYLALHGVHPRQGTWDGFWISFDIVVTLPISWAVLASDWSRHSTSSRSTVLGVGLGYASTCAAFFIIGILAISGSSELSHTLGNTYSPTAFANGLLALPIGVLALAILAIDEVDEVFANIYSTAISAQNLFAKVDRRVLALGVGLVATTLATFINLETYESFLLLIGALFLPLVAVLITDWFVLRRILFGTPGARFSVTEPQSKRLRYLLVWLTGFCVYSLISPAQVAGWSDFWVAAREHLSWFPVIAGSATLTTLACTSLLTLLVGALSVRR
jgi:nucleobase:cation symporter-1, NCS1 family